MAIFNSYVSWGHHLVGNFHRISHYKPSILEYPPNFWKPQIIDPDAVLVADEVSCGGPERKGSQGQEFGTI